MLKKSFNSLVFTCLLFGTFSSYAQQLKLPFNPEVAVADLYFGKAKQLSDSLKYDMSSPYYEEAAKRYEKAGEWEKFIKANNRIAENFWKQEKYQEALSHSEKTLSFGLEKLPGKREAIMETYLLFGNIYIRTGTYDKALESYKKALTAAPDVLKNRKDIKPIIYKKIADAYVYIGNYKEALNHYQKSLDLSPKTDEVDFYMNMGVAYALLGSYDKALQYYEKDLVVQLNKKDKNYPKIARVYLNIGNLYQDQGFYDKTIDYYRKALDIQLKISGDKHSETAVIYMNMGNVLARQGAYEKALDYYRKTLSIQQAILGDGHIEVARTYANMGLVYEHLSQFEKAIDCFQKALPVQLKKFGEDHFEVARTYNNLGVTYERWKNYDKALFYDKKALDIRLKTNHPDLPRSYVNTAVVLAALGDLEQANINYEKALDLWRKLFGEYHPETALCYNNIGRNYEAQGRYDKALAYFQKALASLAKDFKETNAYKNPSLNKINSKLRMLEVLGWKAFTLRKKHLNKSKNIRDLKASFETYGHAVDLVELMQSEYTAASDKQELMKNSVGVYENGIKTAFEIYSATNDKRFLADAFEIAERGKAFLLREAFRESEAKHSAGIPDSLVGQEKDLKIEITFLERKLAEAEQQKNSEKIADYRNKLFDRKTTLSKLIENLEQKFPDYYRMKYDTRVASAETLRKKLLDEKTALVEYFWGDSAVYVFTITQTNLQLREIKKPETVHKKIDELRTLLTVPPGSGVDQKKQFARLARNLYDILLADLKNLSGVSRLSIVPDGPLNYLPFDVLLTKETPSDVSYAKFSYLLKRYDIGYAYSATLSEQNTAKKDRTNNGLCLAFAPSYDKETSGAKSAVRGSLGTLREGAYTALPGARKEVAFLAEHLQGDFRFGNSATEASFKKEAGAYGILHLAMHGETDEEQPMNSRLIFTPSQKEKEDGFLHAYELYNLRLNADLVVLSACRTGTGRYVRGEGVMSLARAFMYAGVPSVLLTLWNADDESSARLMADFYKALQEKDSKSEALRKAKLAYLESSGDRLSHPFYWAGFSTFGNTQPLPVGGSNTVMTWLVGGGVFFIVGTGFLWSRRRRKKAVRQKKGQPV